MTKRNHTSVILIRLFFNCFKNKISLSVLVVLRLMPINSCYAQGSITRFLSLLEFRCQAHAPTTLQPYVINILGNPTGD